VTGWPRDPTRVATLKSCEVSLAWAYKGIRVERARVRGRHRDRRRVATVESGKVSLAWAHKGIRMERAGWGADRRQLPRR